MLLLTENTTPQALCIEIERHSNVIALTESGLLKMSAKKLAKHKKYVKDLHQAIMQMTKIDTICDNLSDEELLAELGI